MPQFQRQVGFLAGAVEGAEHDKGEQHYDGEASDGAVLLCDDREDEVRMGVGQ